MAFSDRMNDCADRHIGVSLGGSPTEQYLPLGLTRSRSMFQSRSPALAVHNTRSKVPAVLHAVGGNIELVYSVFSGSGNRRDLRKAQFGLVNLVFVHKVNLVLAPCFGNVSNNSWRLAQ
eukprot:1199068-Pyramimonas_sp.AAC.1